MGAKANQAQGVRDRARDARLRAARERRLSLDPDKVARERRIDEATVDVEVAWEAREVALQGVKDAELTALAAIKRLMDEKVSGRAVAELTGLDHATVRRLQALTAEEEGLGVSPAAAVPGEPA